MLEQIGTFLVSEAIQVGRRSISGWTQTQEKLVWYGKFGATGRLSVRLAVKLPAQETVKYSLTVGRQALTELAEHVAAKRIRYRETVAQGLSSAPRAFIGLLKGENLGKQLVKLV